MSMIEKTESAATKNDQDMPQPAEKTAVEPGLEPKKTVDPVRRLTWIVLAVVILLFVWYVLADRYAPWTDQARVQAWIVPISPKVAGKATPPRSINVNSSRSNLAVECSGGCPASAFVARDRGVEADFSLVGGE